MKNETIKRYYKLKYQKLILSAIIDFVGMVSYLFPVVGGSFDLVWGPISGLFIYLLFPKHKGMAILGAAEEMLPVTDFIPTACMTWILVYKNNKKALSEFAKNEVGDEQLVQEILNSHNI